MSVGSSVAALHEEPLSGSPVSVVTVTYNSAAQLPGLLDSLVEGLEGVSDTETVVVDNDSADSSVALARAHPSGPRVICTGRNGGYAAGINAAISTIRPDRSVLILNPDIRLTRGAVRRMLDSVSAPTVGVAVPRMLHENGTLALSLRREPSVATVWFESLLGGRLASKVGASEIIDDPDLYARGGPVEWATGAALLISPRARAAVGDWDESFFLYSEEVDYLRRVRSEGLSVLYVPDAQVTHIGGECHTNPRLAALLTANRIRYFARHHGPLPTALFRLGVAVGSAMRSALGPSHRASLRAALALRNSV